MFGFDGWFYCYGVLYCSYEFFGYLYVVVVYVVIGVVDWYWCVGGGVC